MIVNHTLSFINHSIMIHSDVSQQLLNVFMYAKKNWVWGLVYLFTHTVHRHNHIERNITITYLEILTDGKSVKLSTLGSIYLNEISMLRTTSPDRMLGSSSLFLILWRARMSSSPLHVSLALRRSERNLSFMWALDWTSTSWSSLLNFTNNWILKAGSRLDSSRWIEGSVSTQVPHSRTR